MGCHFGGNQGKAMNDNDWEYIGGALTAALVACVVYWVLAGLA